MKKKISFLSYLKKYWFFAIISPLFMIGEVLVDLMQPKLMSRIINTVVESGELDVVMNSIFSTAIEMIVLVAIGGFMGLMCCYTASRASQGFGNDVRVDAFNKVMSLSLQQTDKFTTGSLVTRLTNDITQVQNFINVLLRMALRAPGMLIGALIMVHGDNSGLVLPPRIAPVQTRVIPIAQHKEGVLEKANELTERLKKAGYSVKIDDSEKSPGWKFSEQEMLGIPTRIEIGPKDIEQNQVVVVRRDTREKIVVSLDEIETKLGEILETIQKDMYDRAKAFLDSHIDFAETMDEMNEKFNTKRGFIKAKWCGSAECEDEIKAATGGATTRCICKEDQVKDGDTCIFCGKQAKHVVYFGKAY